LLHRFFAKSVIDITPGQGNFGMACLKQRVGYFCLAFSEEHAEYLTRKFQAAALTFMAEEGTALYNPKCATAMSSKKPEKQNTKTAQKPKKQKIKEESCDDDPDKPPAKKGKKSQKKTRKKKGGAMDSDGDPQSSDDNISSSWDLSDD
jgi:hypothetical protein